MQSLSAGLLWKLRARSWASTTLRVGVGLLITALLAGPILAVVLGAFRTSAPGLPGEWSSAAVTGVLDNTGALRSVRNTGILVLTVVPLAVATALYFAWTAARTNTPLKWLITPMMGVSLAVPPLFFAMSWRLVGNERSGLLHQLTAAMPAVPALSFDADSWAGLILISAVKLAGLVYFIVLGPVMAMDSTQEEASRLSGAGPFTTFARVTLPALGPALLGAALLSVVVCLEFFDIPLLLGTSSRIRVISTEIFDALNNSIPPDYPGSFALSLLPVVAVCAIVLVQRKVLGGRSFQTVGGKGSRAKMLDLGRGRGINAVVVVLALTALVVLPVAQLVVGSLQPVFGVDSGQYGLQSYRAVLDQPELRAAIRNSLLLGVLGGGVSMMLALVLALLGARRGATAVDRGVSYASWLPWAAPGIILSIGIYSVFLFVPGLSTFYGTIWIMLAGLVISVMPVAARAAEGAVAQISVELQDAARTSGAGPVRMFLDVVLRLVLPSFLSGWLVSAIIVSGNLAVTIMLGSPTSTPSVPVTAYRLMTAGSVSQAAALFLMFMACLSVVLVVLLALRYATRVTLLGRRPAPEDEPAIEAISQPGVPVGVR